MLKTVPVSEDESVGSNQQKAQRACLMFEEMLIYLDLGKHLGKKTPTDKMK